MVNQRDSLEPWSSPTKRYSAVYSLIIEGLTLQEKKELLDTSIRRRRLEIRAHGQHYTFDTLHHLPLLERTTHFQAILYCDRCPEYFISSNNVKEAIAEVEIHNHHAYTLLYHP